MFSSIHYIAVSTLLSAFLALVWKNSSWFNVTLKMLLATMSVWGIYLILHG